MYCVFCQYGITNVTALPSPLATGGEDAPRMSIKFTGFDRAVSYRFPDAAGTFVGVDLYLEQIFAADIDEFCRNFDDERLFVESSDSDVFRFDGMFTDIVTVELDPGFFVHCTDEYIDVAPLPIVTDIEYGTVPAESEIRTDGGFLQSGRNVDFGPF